MKKIIASILAAVLVALPVAAADYVPSPDAYDIEVVVHPATEDTPAHYGYIVDQEGNVVDTIDVNDVNEIIIYFLSRMVDEEGNRLFNIFMDGDVVYSENAPEEIEELIVAAEAELLQNALADIVENFSAEWATRTNGVPEANAQIARIFNVEAAKEIMDMFAAGYKLRFSLKIKNIDADTTFAVIHKNTGAEKWVFENHTISEDGIVTLEVGGLSPFAILVDSGADPVVDDETPKSPQTGVNAYSVALAIATVLLLGGAVVCGKKAYGKA